ncbi:ATP-binding cassette domain-containing protein [Nakamurella sp. YIM 132087]|uniref:ATP-binding cassette domain-containing protein n=1 Tax=Nakamurella alba TaxID=2665158 RepID=A0A7K1FRC4_9ACTN|nr:ATP-binding cassette domain-containing protein [Nakamurella alba]MTD16697.1 ATP-binding cassette domain-containing protein [Nakamurella alba]
MTAPTLLRRNRRQIERSSSRSGLWVLAIALLLFFQFHVGGFITQGNIVQILVNLAPTLIAAIPAARLLITGNVDLSIAGGYAVLGVLCGFLVSGTGSPLIGLLGTLAGGALLGLLNGTLVRVLQISPIIVTLGLGTVYTALAYLTTNGNPIYDFPSSFSFIAQTRIAGIPVPVIVALLAFAIGAYLLSRTVSGLHSYAIGGNFQAAKLSGVRADRHVLLLYVYMGISVGLLAVVTTASIGSASPTNGVGFEIDVLTAVILGGVAFNGGAGRWTGVLIGVVVLGILQAGFVFEGLNSYYQLLAKGMLLLVALGADQLVAARRRRTKGARSEPGPASDAAAQEAVEIVRRAPDPDAGLLEVDGLRKSYGAVTAVADVSFTARRGTVTCLLGDNGAGKSTLIKMLSGVHKPDAGTIRLDGQELHLEQPADAHLAGIHTVYQDLALATNLGAALNLVLGAEPYQPGRKWLGLLDRARSEKIARERLSSLGIDLSDYFRPVGELSGGQRQCVAIARVNVEGASVVILDEPTAALGVRQTANVLRLARTLADTGAAVIIITHDVDSVMEVADHVVVLNLGRVLFEGDIDEVDAGRLIHLMAGYTGGVSVAQ